MSSLNVEPASGIALRDGEVVHRRDLVTLIGHGGRVWPNLPTPGPQFGQSAFAELILTNQRLIFLPRKATGVFRLPVISALVGLFTSVAPLAKRIEFELRDITQFHTWSPPFSLPIMFQVGADGWSIDLRRRRFPPTSADQAAMAEQYAAIESAWSAARGA